MKLQRPNKRKKLVLLQKKASEATQVSADSLAEFYDWLNNITQRVESADREELDKTT